jgi:hypothetical protein
MTDCLTTWVPEVAIQHILMKKIEEAMRYILYSASSSGQGCSCPEHSPIEVCPLTHSLEVKAKVLMSHKPRSLGDGIALAL